MQSAPSQHPQIFLSFSDDDQALARRLQQDLETAGAAVRDTSGVARDAASADVLRQYDSLVIVLTPAAAASSRVQAEAFTALELQRTGQGSLKTVLLFVAKMVDSAAMPPSWTSLQRVNALPYYTVGLAELCSAVGLSAVPLPMSSIAMETDVSRGLDFGAPDAAAPDLAEAAPAQEKVTLAEPSAPDEESASAAPASPAPAPALPSWEDTPTIIAPGRAQAPATEVAPPLPPPAGVSSTPPAPAPAPATPPASRPSPIYPAAPPPPPAPEGELLRGIPSGAPAPAAPAPPAPPVPPTYTPPPFGANILDGAPAPGYGAPPRPQPPAQPQPPAESYPPYPPAAGYAPPPAYGAPPNPMAPAPQGGYGYPGPFSPWPAAPASPVAVAEQVTFTAYHVREITPQAWEPLYVYIALDTPQAQSQVQAAAQAVLAGRMGEFRPAMAAETSWLRRGAQLTFVPTMPGCVFNPPEQTVPWQADVQQLAFGMQAVTARPGFALNGSVQVFTGPLLRADIPISVFVRQPTVPGMYSQAQQPPQPRTFATSIARAYRKVFASYSHRDTSVVQSCETAAQVTGDRYLRDVTLLRGGEQWNDRLLQAIGEADLFQLFWSENAARSPAVQTEWRHALALQPARGNFIRPVFWSRQPYPIPPELQAIHFERLSLARLGWGKLRIFVHDALGLG